MKKPAIFLDRDGTLMVDHGFVGDPSMVELLPHVGESLRRLRDAGYTLLVVSNQSGVARGYFDMAAVAAVETALATQLAADAARLDGFYVCPHLDAGCLCRKPLPGLLQAAAAEHGVDLASSVMIGDRGSDIAAGQALAIPGLLVLTGALAYSGPVPDGIFAGLAGATDWILSHGA